MILALSLALALLPTQDAAVAQESVPQPFFAPRRRALVVGASSYEHLGRLRYAAGDAEKFAEALTGRLGFEADAVKLLTDRSDDPLLTPTAGHVLGELEALLADQRGAATDLFVFYFSGHGIGLPEGDYLMPTDARPESALRVGLPVREIVERLASARMKNVLVIVDACREGHANPFGTELRTLADAARIAVVLGCEPGKQSYEDARLGGGIFTAALLQALNDEELRDPVSGALWASRVTASAAERVLARTEGRDPVQRPYAWTDATRDVLLEARPVGDVAQFLAEAGRLDPEAFLAAAGEYGMLLHLNGYYLQAIEVLKSAEQLRPLGPEQGLVLASALTAVGRSVEAARVLAEIRETEPDSLQALVAAIVDLSGAVAADERSAAATALWETGLALPLDLIVLLVNAHQQGGSGAEAVKLASEVIAQTPEGSRQRAYLRAVLASLQPGTGDPLAAMAEAESLPGAYPTLKMLRQEHVAFAATFAGFDASIALLDEAIELWPDDGNWYALRAWHRRQRATTVSEFDPLVEDVVAALERPMEPAYLWMLVRAAGGRAPEFAEGFRAQAAQHPLAWQAQLAAIFAAQPEDMREAVAAAARLSPRPALVYAAMARVTHDGANERYVRATEAMEPEDPMREAIHQELVWLQTTLYERLTPMASDFGGDAEAWSLLQDLSERILAYEPFARLLLRHAGERTVEARLPAGLVRVAFRAFANTGRSELLASVRRSIAPGTLYEDTLLWQEAVVLACAGRDAEARALLGERASPRSLVMREIGVELMRLLRLRSGGDPEELKTAPTLSTDLLARALRALSLREIGEHGEAELITESAIDQNPGAYFYALTALISARPELDPMDEAWRASTLQPGNPLTAAWSFAGDAGVTAFTGSYSFVVKYAPQDAEGELRGTDSRLQLSVLPDGQVIGALMLADGGAMVVQGRVDARGNLEAQALRGAGATAEAYILLAKIAPPALYREYSAFSEQGQRFDLITPDGLRRIWYSLFEG